MAVIGSLLQKTAGFQRNAENMRTLLQLSHTRGEAVMRGGGSPAVEKLHQKGKLTARERIERLIDPGSSFLEIGLFAAYEMYQQFGGAPSAGTVFGIGMIHG